MSKKNNSNQKQSVKEVAVKEINKDDLVDFFNNAINTKYRPNKLKKGDVVDSMVAFKLRPCVIIGVEKNNVYAIPLSTTRMIIIFVNVKVDSLEKIVIFLNQ